MTSGRLSLRLAAPAALYWSFVPLLQIAALAVVWPWKGSKVSFARAIDCFFASQDPWSLWLCAFAAIWALIPPVRVFSWTQNPWFWYAPAMAVGLWTAWLDYGFFRSISQRSFLRACCDLAMERAIVWTAGIACFMGSAAWQVVASRFGL
jgi:hypothetical protein